MTALTECRDASLREWDVAYVESAGRTYFQSVEWAEIWSRYYRGRVKPAGLWLGFSDGTRAVVPLVTFQRRSHRAPLHVSSVVGTYGGVLGRDLTVAHLSAVLQHLRTLPTVDWIANPFADPPAPACGDRDMSTRTVMLDAGMATTKGRMSKGHRSALTQALRSGVLVRRASTTEDWRDYYGLYRQSLDRWGRAATSRYGWRLCELLQKREPAVSLWLADLEGVPVAGAVTVDGDGYVGYWHGAAAPAAFSVRAVNLLLTTVMEDATSHGVRYFDLLPSGGHDGVEAFKRSFGAEVRPVPRLPAASASESATSRAIAVARWMATSAVRPLHAASEGDR